jgi:hypothetical protein
MAKQSKTEEEIAPELMEQIKRHQPDEKPPALATDGKGAYREAMFQTWGKVPEYSGKGRPPTTLKPENEMLSTILLVRSTHYASNWQTLQNRHVGNSAHQLGLPDSPITSGPPRSFCTSCLFPS